MAADLDQVKYDVAVANRVLAAVGLSAGMFASLGHASLRVPSQPDTFVVKGRGYTVDALSEVRPEEMVVCDLEGFKIDGPPNATQCFEVKMHSTIYKLRPDVQSVVHVHPRYTVLMSVLGQRLRAMCQEGALLVREPLPVYPHTKIIQTEDEGMEVAKLLGDGKAVLLHGHGAATAGDSLEETVMNMLQLEEQARMNYLAFSAAGPDYPSIADELLEEMANPVPNASLPHFAELLKHRGSQPRVNGVWMYYTRLVSADL